MGIDANKALAATAIGCLVLAGTSIGGWYYVDGLSRARPQPVAEAKAAKLARYRLEEEPHRLTLVSHVLPRMNGRRSSSVPVMVKLVVSGTNGLRAVCARLPHIKEAVLSALSTSANMVTDEGGRLNLARMEPQLRQAINRVMQGNPVKSLHAVMISAGGVMGGAQAECRAALKQVAQKRS